MKEEAPPSCSSPKGPVSSWQTGGSGRRQQHGPGQQPCQLEERLAALATEGRGWALLFELLDRAEPSLRTWPGPISSHRANSFLCLGNTPGPNSHSRSQDLSMLAAWPYSLGEMKHRDTRSPGEETDHKQASGSQVALRLGGCSSGSGC